MKTCPSILCLLALSAISASAEEPAKPVDVTLSVMKGVNYFRAQAATNEDGWFFHPIEGARVVAWKTNTIHLKIIEVNVPAYRYQDPYQVLVPGNSPTDPMQQVTRYRTVVRNPSGDHLEKRETYDPTGPIARDITTPIYEKDIGCRWRYGGLGNNALAILALRRCGIRSDDPLISRPAYNLVNLVSSFGLPDTTYDLAWLTAGFAVMPGDDYKRLTEQCAAKLLDAQIITGPATGLWGPVAVNTPLASAFLKTLEKLAADKKSVQTQFAEEERKKPTGKPSARAARLQEDMEKLDGRLIELQANSTRVTQLGLLMFDNFGNAQFGMDAWGRRTLVYQADRLNIVTLPYLIENQISADLESTALVLFALRTALENGRLPAKTWRPEPPKTVVTVGAPPAPVASDFPPAREVREVIARAAKAILAARTPAGQWSELNIDQGVTDFAWLKSVPQVSASEFLPLPQRITLASTARGAAALANIQIMQTGKPASAALETDGCRQLVEDLAHDKLSLTNADIRFPYDAILHSTVLQTKNGKAARTDFSIWNEMTDWLLRQQTIAGNWGREKEWVLMPSTSVLALRESLKSITDADLVKRYDKPHLTPAMFPPGNQPWYSASEASYFSAAALLYLADGLPEGWIPSTTAAPDEPAKESAL